MTGPSSMWSNCNDEDSGNEREFDGDYCIEYDDGVTVEQLASIAGIDLEDYRRDHEV